jgi:hypothetical protein
VAAGTYIQVGITLNPTTIIHGNYTNTLIVVWAEDVYGKPTIVAVPGSNFRISDNGNGFYSGQTGTIIYSSNNRVTFTFSNGQATVFFGDPYYGDNPTISVAQYGSGNYNTVAQVQATVQ